MPTAFTYVKGQNNLALAAAYSPGTGPPITGDSLGMFEGIGQIDTGLTAMATADLTSVIVGPGCGVNIGTNAGSLQFDTDLFDYGGSGASVYAAGGSGSIWDALVWRPANGRTILYASSVTITAMRVESGLVICPSSVVVDTVDMYGGQARIEEHGSDTVGNTVVKSGAVLEVRRRIAGTVRVEAGGTLIYDVDSSTSSGVITLAGPGARLIHRKGALNVYGSAGIYDRSKLEKVYAVTITDTKDLTEIVGAVSPTFTRTTIGVGSTKIPG